MPPVKRGKIAQAPLPTTGEKKASPEKVPTYAQNSLYRLNESTEGEFHFTQEQERELMAEGIWPERQWGIWRHAMQRGIDAY